MKSGSQCFLVLTLTTLVFSGCKPTSSEVAASPATGGDEEKLLNMALKTSGKKVSARERGVIMRMLKLSEEDLIIGLNVCAELSDGQYPTSLDPETVLKQTGAWVLAKYGEVDNLPADLKKEIEERILDTFFMAAYYKKLIRQRKSPTYYGENITVKDDDRVLMWWNVSDNRYRAILGNLTRKSVTAEELAELKKPTLE